MAELDSGERNMDVGADCASTMLSKSIYNLGESLAPRSPSSLPPYEPNDSRSAF